MCGIVGLKGDFSRTTCLEIINKMSQAIVHRGPDDFGAWAEDGFGFGMRRLSIIDLEGGHQPIWDDVKRLGLVFNGEIYNYLSLREQLEKRGCTSWKTQSDTEVVLKSLAMFGEAGIHNFNGMFGFAAWDARSKSLLLVRDRIGEKPLYYFWDGKTFIFASEIKAILASGLVTRTLNKQAIWDYLTFRYVPGPRTIWEGINKISPGHLLRLSGQSPPEEICYWNTDVVGGQSEYHEERTDKEFTELFLNAVELRLIASDVPVGVFLSGGLDSSAIAAAAVELGHKDFHTFSVGFDEDVKFSELPYAREVAQRVGARHHEVIINQKQFLNALPNMVHSSDEPLADLSMVPLLALSKLARESVKVVMSGEGSDEILGGYDFDQIEQKLERVRFLKKLPSNMVSTIALLAEYLPHSRLQRRLKKLATIGLADWNKSELPNMTNLYTQDHKKRLWPDASLQDSNRILETQYNSVASLDPIEQMLAVYQKSWLSEDLLMKADKATMANSLEARMPFLDYRLIEWANVQPKAAKIKRFSRRRFQTKSVLRRFCSTRLPASIISRPKRGFPVPAYEWLQTGLEDWARKILLDPSSRLTHFMQQPVIDHLLVCARSGERDAQHQLWALIVLELWMREWDASLA